MAMEGLAANDKRTPAPMMTKTVANSARSTVNHQSTSKLRSARDSLMRRLAPRGEPPLARFANAPIRTTAPRFSSPAVSAQFDARQGGHERPKMIATHLEIGILIIGSTGWGEQHHGLRSGAGGRIAGRPRQRHWKRSATLEGDLAAQRCRKRFTCLADEVGPGDARKTRRQIRE